MNDKIRSILHTAWNEPRHFFFWLAMLSICGFVAAAGAAALLGTWQMLAFLALGCALCFAISIPAFILAWIPPVRRLFSWLLRWRFLALACLVTLVALFYAVEDWRGRSAWQAYKRAGEAKGERYDLASIAPPPVPADQNFFETPLWSDLHFVETNGVVGWSDEDRNKRVIFSIYGPATGNSAPSIGNWAKAQHVDLAAWQAYYRGSNNLFAAEGRLATNYFPIAKEPQTPAVDVLLALSRFETNRQLLITAAARPQARFWVNYDAGFASLLPHLARMKSWSQYLALHADAALKAGDRETALQDTRLLFRLIEASRAEPTLISHLVRIAMTQIALQPIWEGLADRQWNDGDLVALEGGLRKMDFLADYQFAMRGERACNVWAVDYIYKMGMTGLSQMGASDENSGPSGLDQFLGRAAFQLIPAGWFDQNKLSLCRMHDQYFLPLAGDANHRVVRPALIRQAESAVGSLRIRPYDAFSRLLLPALGRAAEKFARAQCSADLARVACAPERYRLANGQFPDTLEALAPKFIEKLPYDVINGQPLKYRRTDDGQFVLYSVGLNETDDGGQIVLTKSGNADINKGDWVWRYPAK
ncbi:MAG: hypothetical protein ACLQU3_31655 [Limisphaerales bacterium]